MFSRGLFGGLAAGLVAATAVAVPVTLAATDLEPKTPAAITRSAPVSEVELGDVTLDDLAAELEKLGLEVTISSTDDQDHGQESDQDWDRDQDQGTADHEQDVEDDNHQHEEYGDEPPPLGAFGIDGDSIDLSTAASPEIAESARRIWERFAELIPADQRQMVTGFELNSSEFGGGYVYPDTDDPTKWTLGIGEGLGQDLDYVLIHEFAHLLTLQAKEVPPDLSGEASCQTYHTGEGCALSGSTMAEFVARFWPQDQLDMLAELYETEDYDGLDTFYQQHADEFVTDYAASNPAEDLAETFAIFVTQDRPTGSTVADQKIELLWADPTMVDLRTQIRSAL